MKLSYKAAKSDGKMVKGIVEAKTKEEAAAYLRSRELLPIHIWIKEPGLKLPFKLNRFKGSDLVFFTRQLSSILASGITLVQALNILKEQTQNPAVKEVIMGIAVDIEGGKSLSLALLRYPGIFSPVYISLIQAAEASGLLDKVLLRLSENLEKGQRLKRAVRGALIYPSIILIGMAIVVFVMMVFVIPQLAVLYTSLNISMPLPTRIVIGISHFFTIVWPLLLGLGVILFFSYKRWYKTDSGRHALDAFKLRIPILGRIQNLMILTEFSRTLGLLIGAGTLVVEALNQVANIAGNILYQEAVSVIAKRVEKGITIGDSMSYSPLFPPILVQMVRIGEETGKLNESLLKVSEYFEEEVDQAVKNLMTALEPLILILLGIGVAFLIISVITPIYSLMSSIQ